MKTSAEMADYIIKQFEGGADLANIEIGLNQGVFEIWNPEGDLPPEIVIKREFYQGCYLDTGMTPADLAGYLESVAKNLTTMFRDTPYGYLTVTISAIS